MEKAKCKQCGCMHDRDVVQRGGCVVRQAEKMGGKVITTKSPIVWKKEGEK